MNLRELQTAVENAIQVAYDCGEKPKDIIVSLQIDDKADPHHGFVQSDEDVELTYDNNATASGCVIGAWRDTNAES